MAIDFSKLGGLLEEEKERDSRGSFGPRVLWWRPKAGENRIRICPPWTSEGPNANWPIREVYRHWGVGEGGYVEEGGTSFTCPVKTKDGPGGTCEVCDLVTALKASGSPADNDIAKELYAKRRLYSNIVDLKDPVYTEADLEEWETNARDGDECHFEVGDTKVQVYSYGTTIYKQLLDYFQDELDLSDFNAPVELKLTREGKGKFDTNYRLRINPKSKPFTPTGNFEDLVYNLDEVTPFPREGAMAAVLSGESGKKNNALGSGAVSKAPSLPPPALEEEEDVEPPACFKDLNTQDDNDPVCMGGKDDDGSVYDPCEFVTECREAKLVALSKNNPSRSRRRTSSAPAPATTGSIDDVEREMREMLGQ